MVPVRAGIQIAETKDEKQGLTWGGDAPLPRRQIEQYALAPFLAEVSPEAIAVGERGMIAPRLRGTDLLLRTSGT